MAMELSVTSSFGSQKASYICMEYPYVTFLFVLRMLAIDYVSRYELKHDSTSFECAIPKAGIGYVESILLIEACWSWNANDQMFS